MKTVSRQFWFVLLCLTLVALACQFVTEGNSQEDTGATTEATGTITDVTGGNSQEDAGATIEATGMTTDVPGSCDTPVPLPSPTARPAGSQVTDLAGLVLPLAELPCDYEPLLENENMLQPGDQLTMNIEVRSTFAYFNPEFNEGVNGFTTYLPPVLLKTTLIRECTPKFSGAGYMMPIQKAQLYPVTSQSRMPLSCIPALSD